MAYLVGKREIFSISYHPTVGKRSLTDEEKLLKEIIDTFGYIE
jgi:peptide subunit release factor RF-3